MNKFFPVKSSSELPTVVEGKLSAFFVLSNASNWLLVAINSGYHFHHKINCVSETNCMCFKSAVTIIRLLSWPCAVFKNPLIIRLNKQQFSSNKTLRSVCTLFPLLKHHISRKRHLKPLPVFILCIQSTYILTTRSKNGRVLHESERNELRLWNILMQCVNAHTRWLKSKLRFISLIGLT